MHSSWFGFGGQTGFRDFRNWWHIEKNFCHRAGRDLNLTAEAEEAWHAWEAAGRAASRSGAVL
jgi:hypothetical protein